MGVLITGDSGVGKSEAALELIRRGHQLVADDVVDICRVSDNRLTGECPEMVRHFMEIRGIGIIDIRAMYGIGAVAQSKSIDLVIHMEKWVEGEDYDRLGLNDEYITILGVKVPSQTMPVRPGRNLAIIIEVAARNLSMKKLGFSATRELDRRMNEMIVKRFRSRRAESELTYFHNYNIQEAFSMIYVGIDVGGTGIQVGLVDESGKILCKGGIVTRTGYPLRHAGEEQWRTACWTPSTRAATRWVT